MKKENIARYTRDNLPEGRVNWERVLSTTDEEIERQAREDGTWTDEEMADASFAISDGGKRPISIRLDDDVLEYFRGTGRGYQSRINAVLKAYVRRRAKR